MGATIRWWNVPCGNHHRNPYQIKIVCHYSKGIEQEESIENVHNATGKFYMSISES